MPNRMIMKGWLRGARLAALVLCFASRPGAFDAGKAGFAIKYKDETSPYRVSAVFLMPGEILDVKIAGNERGRFRLETPASAQAETTRPPDSIAGTGSVSWSWKAPDSAGLYPLRLSRDSTQDTILLNAFVMVPASEMKDGYLRGYQIGDYPKSLLKGLEFYRAPQGFVRVDRESMNAKLSPHFTLGQFLCKQSAALPAYLLLKERLVLKLELVLEKSNQEGYACESFHVMSGYRTPFYNRLIGNVTFSAHQFGGAADIFIDASPEDGEMDDLNRDGSQDGKDSELLFNLVDRMSINEYFLPYIGGIGKYSKNRSHGAFVHVDVRGFRAVW
ncbi:MAG: hypothetical protein ABIW76_19630 [Fibrobacteria bacterium]